MSSTIRRHPRGTSLLEGMIAAAVFAVGLLGTIQMLFIASRQNTTAGRMTHAGAIAEDVRTALHTRGLTFLTSATGPLRPSLCTSDNNVKKLAGDLATMTGACIIDFDAYETAAAKKIIASYSEAARYRRLLVYMPDTNVPPKVDTVIVVVQFQDLGRDIIAKQPMSLYRMAANQARVEL